MNPESRTLSRTPRSTYAKLRDAANIRHTHKRDWSCLPRESHTRKEKMRLANVSWDEKYAAAIASMASLAKEG